MYKKITALIVGALLSMIIFSGCSLPGQKNTENTPPDDIEAINKPIELYLPNTNADGFVTKASMTDGKPEHIISLLINEKALPDGCALLDFAVNGNKSAIMDMNAAYGKAVGNSGTAGEYLQLGSVINTFVTFFAVEEITLTIEGKTLETGHEIYDYPLRFFEDQVAVFVD